MLKLFKTIRDRFRQNPNKKFGVELLIHSKAHKKYIGALMVTTTAHTKEHAARNITADVELHIGKIITLSTNVNGQKH